MLHVRTLSWERKAQLTEARQNLPKSYLKNNSSFSVVEYGIQRKSACGTAIKSFCSGSRLKCSCVVRLSNTNSLFENNNKESSLNNTVLSKYRSSKVYCSMKILYYY